MLPPKEENGWWWITYADPVITFKEFKKVIHHLSTTYPPPKQNWKRRPGRKQGEFCGKLSTKNCHTYYYYIYIYLTIFIINNNND